MLNSFKSFVLQLFSVLSGYVENKPIDETNCIEIEIETEVESESVKLPLENDEIYLAVDHSLSSSSKLEMSMYSPSKKDHLKILPKENITKANLKQCFEDFINELNHDEKAELQSANRLFMPFFESLGKPFSHCQSDAWINDNVIDEYFIALSQQRDRSVASISSLYHKDNLIPRMAISKSNTSFREKLIEAKMIFWPIYENNHYYLLVIVRNKANIALYCLDGLNRTSQHHAFFQWGKDLMKALFKNSRLSFKTKSLVIPSQNNLIDCGSVICYFGKKLLNVPTEKIETVTQCYASKQSCDYSAFRIEIANDITAHRKKAHQKAYREYVDLTGEDPIPPQTRLRSTRSRQSMCK